MQVSQRNSAVDQNGEQQSFKLGFGEYFSGSSMGDVQVSLATLQRLTGIAGEPTKLNVEEAVNRHAPESAERAEILTALAGIGGLVGWKKAVKPVESELGYPMESKFAPKTATERSADELGNLQLKETLQKASDQLTTAAQYAADELSRG